MELPLYELYVSEDGSLEVNAVAAVDIPAIEKTWLAFKDQEPLKFSTNEEERIVVGAAMIPDLKIFRRDENTGEEFNIVFSKETIKSIAQQFYEKGYQANFNLMHKTPMDGVTFFLSFIKDTPRGLVGMAGDYPEGTWFLGAKVTNDEVWAKVKSGEIKGWSVEGMFGFKKPSDEQKFALIEKVLDSEDAFEQIREILSGTN